MEFRIYTINWFFGTMQCQRILGLFKGLANHDIGSRVLCCPAFRLGLRKVVSIFFELLQNESLSKGLTHNYTANPVHNAFLNSSSHYIVYGTRFEVNISQMLPPISWPREPAFPAHTARASALSSSQRTPKAACRVNHASGLPLRHKVLEIK